MDIIALTIYVFLIILFISFVFFVFTKLDIKRDDYRKIIGGFSILIVATISKNPYVIFVSLFIGGLIVASEEFMTNLAAILRTRGDKMSDTLGKIQYTKSTKAEREQKTKKIEKYIKKDLQKEIGNIEQSLEYEDSTTPKREFGINEQVNEKIKKIKNLEKKLKPILTNKFGENIKWQMKIKGLNNKQMIVDGLLIKNDDISEIIEIKYVTKNTINNSLIYIIQRFREKIIKLGMYNPKILFIIVSEDLNPENAKLIEDKFSSLGRFIYFNVDNDNLEEIQL